MLNNFRIASIFAFIPLFFLLPGCASQRSSYGFVKPDSTSQQFYEDFRLCELQNLIFRGRLFIQRRDDCLFEEGWTLSSAPAAFRPSDYTGPNGRLFPLPPLL